MQEEEVGSLSIYFSPQIDQLENNLSCTVDDMTSFDIIVLPKLSSFFPSFFLFITRIYKVLENALPPK